ncbi:MAG: hypothetical protein M0036_13145 [Desulfobacteraceae bacterium]|nr:hypothetical protein [Desulfobacteraceae bacterium]
MPHSMEYIAHENGLIIIWSGMVKGEEVIQSYEARFSSTERLAKLRYVITDYSKALDFDMTPDQIKTIARIANKAALTNRKLFAVAVMPTDISFGMARMFQAYAGDDTTGWHTFVTRNRRDGEVWLRQHLTADLTFANPAASSPS